MGKVFKKKAPKRAAEPEPEPVVEKKKKVEEPEEEEEDVSDEDVSDVSDEEVDEKALEFEFEAFPMEEGDWDGIISMLTQIFLRAEIDAKPFADAIIAQKPFGNVVGPAEDDEEDKMANIVHSLVTSIILDTQDSAPKFNKDVKNYIISRANKHGNKEILKKLEAALDKTEKNTALFINERMLNFPVLVVPPAFQSFSQDVAGLPAPYKNIIYIQKMRVAEKKEESTTPSSSSGGKKKGKAEKKRLAAESLASSKIKFDNLEDNLLLKLKKGSAEYFDFPVHMDVEPGSKFHIVEENGEKWAPYRRVVLMDAERFNEFLARVAAGEGCIEEDD